MLDLAGSWKLAQADGKHSTTMAIPGDVHSALIAAKIIPDPYIGRNEYDVRWVAEEEWVASRTFEWDGGAGHWHLDIDYLDTVAEIRINGKKVLEADNCFRRYKPDVTKALKRGTNKIEIRFLSNVKEAAKRQKAQPYYVPYSLGNCPIPDGNMLRKPACHFGWDWNLAIMPFGAYGNVKLEHAVSTRVQHVLSSQIHNADGSVDVDLTVLLHKFNSKDAGVSIHFGDERRHIIINGDNHTERFHIANPQFWWPSGLGKQKLYGFHVRCEDQLIFHRVGLREIELITTKDEVGSRFALKVNGKEVFCRGANWIPADALPSRATPELTRKLLQAAVDANMNMIRVWGGGYYEQDWFYDLCDELGLMVWQDFQFACNLYPATKEFLREAHA